MNFKQIIKNKTLRNAGWIVGGRVFNKALAFLVGIVTARYLGPGNYGLVNYAAAYTTFFASICTLGIESVIIKNFSDHPDQEGQTLGTAMILRSLSSLLSAVMIVGIVTVVDRGDPTTVWVVALSTIGLLFQALDNFKQWFQSRLQSKYGTMATTIAYILVSGYKILLLMAGKPVTWFALATAIDHLAVAVFLFAAYRKNGGPAFSWSGRKAKELLRASSSYIVAGLMVSVYASTDKLMLKQMMDATAVGYYGLAVSLSTTWAFLLQAVIDSVYPSVIRAYKSDAELFEKRNRQLYAIVIYTALFVSLVICLLAQPIVRILYGTEYLPAVQPLRIVAWYTTFSYLGVARNAWMVCLNRQKYLKYLYGSAAVINVVLNYLLIPTLGASGAAAASLVTQISTTVLLPSLIPPLWPNTRLMLEAVVLKGVLPKK